ncbi:MAG: hypothetical protein R3F15_05925 [Lysobacterales bacterium]
MTAAAMRRVDDVQADETEVVAVAHCRQARDWLAVDPSQQESARIGHVKGFGILQAWVPAFLPCPSDRDIDVGPGHDRDVEAALLVVDGQALPRNGVAQIIPPPPGDNKSPSLKIAPTARGLQPRAELIALRRADTEYSPSLGASNVSLPLIPDHPVADMRQLCILLLTLGLVDPLFAETLSVGNSEVRIPAPNGYSRMTPEMASTAVLETSMADGMNDLLAIYISDDEAAGARIGEAPDMNRYFVIKVNKELKNLALGIADFARLRNQVDEQNEQAIASAQAQMADQIRENSEAVSTALNVDLDLQITPMTPMAAHVNEEHAIAFSMYLNTSAVINGEQTDTALVVTSTYINVAGKVLFLYTYAPSADLDWTRQASKDWAATILASNDKAEPAEKLNWGIDWGRVAEKGLIGAAVGGVIGLIMWIASWRKRKRTDR